MTAKKRLRAEEGRVFLAGETLSPDDAEAVGRAILRVAQEARAQGAAIAQAAADAAARRLEEARANLAKAEAAVAAHR